MTVVGGLRSRAGVVIGSAFFALLGYLLEQFSFLQDGLNAIPGAPDLSAEIAPLVIGPILLLLTLTLFPGGIGQQIRPIQALAARASASTCTTAGRRRCRSPMSVLETRGVSDPLRRRLREHRRQHLGRRVGDRRHHRPERRGQDDRVQHASPASTSPTAAG